MKHLTKYIPLMAMLLASCTTPTTSSSNEVPSSSEEASSSLIPSTSLTPLEADKKDWKGFSGAVDKIIGEEGHYEQTRISEET